MFTQSDRKSTGSAGRLVEHYFHKSNEGWSPSDPEWHPDHNDRIEVLHGDSADLKLWDQYAKANGKKYGLREYVLSPNEHLTEAQAMRMAEIAMSIIDPNDHHDFALVAHYKKRADGGDAPHYHLVVNEVSFETRKMLDSRERNQRAQLISRLVEYEFGLTPESGSYDNWVVDKLRAIGQTQAADDIAFNLGQSRQLKERKAEAKNLKPAEFSKREHQIAKRKDVDLGSVRHQLRDSAGDPAAVARTLVNLEAEGFTVEKGQKGNVVLIEKNGWRKSIQRVAGLDDKTDFYSSFVELKESIGDGGRSKAEETDGRGILRHPEQIDRPAEALLGGRPYPVIIDRREQYRRKFAGAGASAVREDPVGRGSTGNRNEQDRARPGGFGTHQLSTRRQVRDTLAVAGRRDVTGLQKLRRHTAADQVSGRADGVLDTINKFASSQTEKTKQPTVLNKIMRGKAAAAVSGRLDAVLARIRREQMPTGLQKLKRIAAAHAVSSRIDSVLAQMSSSSDGPVAMYVNDDDPNAWQIRMRQWEQSMRGSMGPPGA